MVETDKSTCQEAHDTMKILKRLLATEPAIVKGAIGLLVALGLIWGLDFTTVGDQLSQTADVLGSLVALLTPVWIRASVTPSVAVVEEIKHGVKVAGPANDLPDGTVIVGRHAEVLTEPEVR